MVVKRTMSLLFAGITIASLCLLWREVSPESQTGILNAQAPVPVENWGVGVQRADMICDVGPVGAAIPKCLKCEPPNSCILNNVGVMVQTGGIDGCEWQNVDGKCIDEPQHTCLEWPNKCGKVDDSQCKLHNGVYRPDCVLQNDSCGPKC